jgi:ribosomal protein S27AE
MKLDDAAKLKQKKCPNCNEFMQRPVQDSKLPAERRWFCGRNKCDTYWPPFHESR